MQKLLLFLLAALILEAMGVVYLSKGLKQLGPPAAMTPRELTRLILEGATNIHVLIGVAMETTFFVMLMVLLRKHDVSLIWPLTSLGFVLTALAARFIRNEEVSFLRWSGVLLIVVGAALVGWSEHAKSSPPPAAPPGNEPKTGRSAA
jgi:drug/metabolite transporter (DMT)-like permease